ncbi:MAG: GDSL family lipase, partial [Lentisphaeria bacterium]|nr:GDSL family lipase [Lentisphaeria bacterium]
ARLPESKILLFGVFPREASAKHIYRKHIKDVNAVICKLADDKNVFYCDITDKFLDKNGTLSKKIMPDLLHPNDNGYEIWAQAMMPYVEKFVGKK